MVSGLLCSGLIVDRRWEGGRSHLMLWWKSNPVGLESSPASLKNSSGEGWENPLMGWTSTGDPYANVGDAGLSFNSEEAAKAFAEKHGWEYEVKKHHTPILKVHNCFIHF
ncbi:hypothetical protein R6Q57_013135 [Mikania cordata]